MNNSELPLPRRRKQKPLHSQTTTMREYILIIMYILQRIRSNLLVHHVKFIQYLPYPLYHIRFDVFLRRGRVGVEDFVGEGDGFGGCGGGGEVGWCGGDGGGVGGEEAEEGGYCGSACGGKGR